MKRSFPSINDSTDIGQLQPNDKESPAKRQKLQGAINQAKTNHKVSTSFVVDGYICHPRLLHKYHVMILCTQKI